MRCVFALGGAVVLSLLAPESLEAWSAGFMGVLTQLYKLFPDLAGLASDVGML
jgi:hypothetical protein